MKAVYIKEFGGPENLEFREVSDPPKPEGKQVLVRVRATGLNRADLLQRKGFYPPPAGYSPNIPGLEFAGEVVETSAATVDTFKPGDRVMGITAGEAQAELVLIDSSLLFRIPDSLSYAQAAAVPEAFITAHDAVFTQGKLKPNETLLITSVGSGVGIAALQVAKAEGIRVIGTSRTAAKIDRCRELGLDVGVLDSKDVRYADEVKAATDGHGANVILDLVGGSYFKENLESLATKGRIILVGLTGGAVAEFELRKALQKYATIIGTLLRPRSTEAKAAATRAFVEHSMRHIESGKIIPVVDRVFPAAEAGMAHEYLESNESFGKVILEF